MNILDPQTLGFRYRTFGVEDPDPSVMDLDPSVVNLDPDPELFGQVGFESLFMA